MRIQPVHPFPARMAPELAIDTLGELGNAGVVLDPMAGSGTVLRHAADMGHNAVGFDVDPLAVLISRVWTTPMCEELLEVVYHEVREDAASRGPGTTYLPWIDDDQETSEFIDYWFGVQQKQELRNISAAILDRSRISDSGDVDAELDILRVALSRIIVTKEPCASLARDTSHSRPHKVVSVSDYEVYQGFERSVREVRKRLRASPPKYQSKISLGDARKLDVKDDSVDMVITSPPYLNAIDYLRGHRLSLVWLGHRLAELREIRSGSVGAERGPDGYQQDVDEIIGAMGCIGDLPSRHRGMVTRYAHDVNCIVREISRVLKPEGTVTLVVGNSCLKGIFVDNSEAIIKSAGLNGLYIRGRFERELPISRRYLPITKDGNLGKRMRTETILKFQKENCVNLAQAH